MLRAPNLTASYVRFIGSNFPMSNSCSRLTVVVVAFAQPPARQCRPHPSADDSEYAGTAGLQKLELVSQLANLVNDVPRGGLSTAPSTKS